MGYVRQFVSAATQPPPSPEYNHQASEARQVIRDDFTGAVSDVIKDGGPYRRITFIKNLLQCVQRPCHIGATSYCYYAISHLSDCHFHTLYIFLYWPPLASATVFIVPYIRVASDSPSATNFLKAVCP